MEIVKKYFENKNIAFYVALGVAAASLIIAIAYGATWIEGSESVGTLVLMIIGALAFVGISYFSPSLGATAMAVCNLIGLALFINSTYLFIFNKAISGLNFSDPEIQNVIVFAVFMILLLIASNVFVWLEMTKKKNVAGAEQAESESAAENACASVEEYEEAPVVSSELSPVSEAETEPQAQMVPKVEKPPRERKVLTPEEKAELYAKRAEAYEKRVKDALSRAETLKACAEKARLQAEKAQASLKPGDKEE